MDKMQVMGMHHEIDFDDWSILGVEAVVVGKITKGRNNSFNKLVITPIRII